MARCDSPTALAVCTAGQWTIEDCAEACDAGEFGSCTTTFTPDGSVGACSCA